MLSRRLLDLLLDQAEKGALNWEILEARTHVLLSRAEANLRKVKAYALIG
jgi:hypothetical protein